MGKEGEERKRESFLRCLFVGEDELRKLKIASTHFRHCTSNCTRLFWFVPFYMVLCSSCVMFLYLTCFIYLCVLFCFCSMLFLCVFWFVFEVRCLFVVVL